MPEKQRVSRHNSRSGKNGVYNPKHNDRQFDVTHAENIDDQRTNQNLYWDWQNGLRNHEENQSGYPSFSQVEREFYEQRYGDYLAGQTARNIKAGHAKRNRTVEDLLADKRICPEETIYQIGKEGDCPPPEVLTAVVQEFMDTMTERFGSHVHILDWALHLDETSPHIHARQVFDIENQYGEIEPKQEKALEALGIRLPYPDKRPGRQNNRKISFDSICRELLLNICEEHGLDVEREAIYGGKENREKNDYIIESQREKIDQQQQQLDSQLNQQAQYDQFLRQQQAQLESNASLLEEEEKLIARIAAQAYDKSVQLVVEQAVTVVKDDTVGSLIRFKERSTGPEKKMRSAIRDAVIQHLDGAIAMIQKQAGKWIRLVSEKLLNPDIRRSNARKIQEAIAPSVHESIQQFRERTRHDPQRKAPRRDDYSR